MSTFVINPAREVVSRDKDIEDQILSNLILAENEDPASELPPAPPVPHQAAIDALEQYLLYSLQSDRNTSELEELLQRERRRIEVHVRQEKAPKTQRRITGFLQLP